MRAVVILKPGDPDSLRIQELPDPVPGKGELLVKVYASGLNRADLLQLMGRYPVPKGSPESIPGLEYAGTVEAVGPGVYGWEKGQRVMGILGGGGYAEKVTVHARTCIPVPDGVDLMAAGAIPEAYLTAYDAVFRQMDLRAGETLLVHAVGSGVGSAAVQLARRAGARTLGTSRTPSKLEAAGKLGLDVGIPSPGWLDTVLKETGGQGVDVILDLVGGPYLAENQQAVRVGGRHIAVGMTGGARAEIDIRLMMVRRVTMRGTVLRARPLEEKAALAQEFTHRVLGGFGDGSLAPVIHRVYPADQVLDALDCMRNNKNFGKILLEWG